MSTTASLTCNCAFTAHSFLEYDWSDGDVVFANSTCFTEELMDSLALQGASLKPGAYLITFTKGLDSKAFKVSHAHILTYTLYCSSIVECTRSQLWLSLCAASSAGCAAVSATVCSITKCVAS